jgi:hypothetical protein
MQLSQTLQYFWRFVLGYSAITIAVPFIHGLLFGWRAGAIALVFIIGLFVMITTTCQPLFVPYRVREWRTRPVSLQYWPHQDFRTLESLTNLLQMEGFRSLQDYTHERRKTGSTVYLVRCFGHQETGCFAEVGFAFSPNDAPQITHLTVFSVFQDGWMLVDSNHLPHRRESLIYAWRNPREVRRHHPDITLEGLLQQHFATREQMCEKLGIHSKTIANWQAYQEIQQELITQPWRRLRRRNLVSGMIAATQYEQNLPKEWWGEYRRVLRRMGAMI